MVGMFFFSGMGEVGQLNRFWTQRTRNLKFFALLGHLGQYFVKKILRFALMIETGTEKADKFANFDSRIIKFCA